MLKKFAVSLLSLCCGSYQLVVMIIFGMGAMSIWFASEYRDLLEDAFLLSKQNEQVINRWNNATAVGNAVFVWWSNLNVSISNWVSVTKQDPIVIVVTKFLLRMTIVLAITFTLYNGVLYAISLDNESNTEKSKDAIINIIWWVIIALISLSLVFLVQSVTISTIAPKN